MKANVLGLFLALALPVRLLADSVTVTITVDNGYGFGFGDTNGIFAGQYYGGVDNCAANQIFGSPCYVFVPPDGTVTDTGPEIYNVIANSSSYIYIVAWSDDATYQGAVASFTDNNTGASVTTSPGSGWPWEVFGTGTNWQPNCSNPPGQHGPPLTGFPYAINDQITIANASAGGPGTSVGWVGNNGWVGSAGVAPPGSLVNGRLDFSGQFNGNIYPVAVPGCLGAGALWMEYNPEPINVACNPFIWGSTPDYGHTPNFLREYLIYRIGPLGQIPGFSTNACTNGCITIYNPDDIVVSTCSNSLAVNYSVAVVDNCCSNYSVMSVPPSGSNFPLGTNFVTTTVTDDCGNSNTCIFAVTVLADTNCSGCLQVQCPGDKSVPCDTAWKFDEPIVTTCCTNLIGGGTTTPTNLLIISQGRITNGVCPQVAITKTWLILDGCGDSNICSQTVTVVGCCTNCLQVQCPTNKTVASCTAWTFDPPVVTTCCSNLIGTDFGTLTNLLIIPTGIVTNGVCPQVDITQTWLILDGCGESNTCSQTVTVIGCCTNCCGTNLGPQNIQWLQCPAPNSQPLFADPLGLNTNGTWIITNLPCYGRVLITQTFPNNPPDQIYWFLNPNLQGVPGAYGSFQDVEAGYGPYYSWGTFGSLLNFYNGYSSPNISYNVNFYFLDGAPNPCTLYLGVVGLASQTTATVSQPVTFRAEYDLAANAPGGNGYASANTTLGGLYGAAVAGATGTVVGSAYSLNSVGDPSNTGWAILQPTSLVALATLPSGSGQDINANPYPPVGSYPCLSLAVNQEGYDGIGFTVGYVCCPTNCLQVECPTNKSVKCGSAWSFDPPIATTCCTQPAGQTSTGATNLLILTTSLVTNGVCPEVTITQSWLIMDGCGDSDACSQTVTVEGCCTNCLQVDCPTNKTVPCGSAWSFDAPVVTTCCSNLIGNDFGTLTNLLVIPTSIVTNGVCPQVDITQTWLIVDGCGDSNTCSQTVTVVGCCTNCISLGCPTNLFISTCSNCAIVHFLAAVTDTCCSNGLTVSCNPPSGSCFPVGTNLVRVTATDDCGGSTTCDFTVTVSQNNCPPIITLCPTNFVLCAGTNGCATMPDEVQATYPVLFGLYNSGVASGFTDEPLPIGSLNDPHWNLVSVPTPSSASPLEFGTNTELQVNPAPQWVAGDDFSAWISPANDSASDGPEGNYDYQTTFLLPAETSVTISGQLAAAATVIDVLLNGVSTGLSFTNGLSALQWNPFSLTGAGLAGTNTLDIIVQNNPLLGSHPPADNQDAPTGLLVEFTTVTIGMPYLNYIPADVQATNCDGSPASGWQSIPPGTRICNDTNIVFTFTNACGDGTSCTSLVTVESCCVAPPSGMVLWLTLDETVGDTCLNSAGFNNGLRYEGASPATPANGPTHTLAQYVDNSLCFDGTGDKVVVPNYAALDFGTQNFTLDAWVKWNGGSGNEILLDHRIQSGANYYGYSWFLFNGRPAVQLATGPFYNFVAAHALAPNTWTHLAVTVQRGSGSGLKFYVNGALSDTFNLTGVAGSLFNTANLWIGASPLAGNLPLSGCLDEIEIFDRVLPASQIAGIYDAGRTGKCRPTCSVPAASAICFDANQLVVPVQICNSGSSPLTVTVTFSGLTAAQAGGSPAVNGPTIFTAYPGTVTLPPDTCTNFTVTITRPPGLTPATVAYYQMLIHDPSGQQFSSIGKLTDLVSIWCNVVNQSTNQLHWTQATNFMFLINNPGSSPVNLNSEVLVLDGNLLPETNLVSLNSLPPGTPVTNQWSVPAFGSQPVSVDVNYLDAQPWTPYYLVLFLNIGENGALIPVASTAFAQVMPPNTGPLLTTSTTNGQVVVSWDLVNAGWTLWSKTDLTSTNWTPVNLPVLQQPDGSQGIRLPLTNQSQFFQLIGPGAP